MRDTHRPQVRLVDGHLERRSSSFDGDRMNLQPIKKGGAARIGFESRRHLGKLGI
jgi:hypothetical protein